LSRQRGRPVVPAIDRDALVRQALAIIDAEGTEALNMRGLAESMGVKAPSLYNHFEGKEAILDAVAHKIVTDVPTRAAQGEPWQHWLVHAMIEYRRVMLAHPNAMDIIIRMPLARSISDSTYMYAAAYMESDGVPPALTRTIAEAAEGLVTGWVLVSIAAGKSGAAAAPDADHRLIVETNTMDEDARFEAAATALITGFVASIATAGMPAKAGALSPKGTRRRPA
jgi:TetR/AcrR family tetracycline transcriptional repressor